MSEIDGVGKIEYVLMDVIEVCVAHSGKTTSSWI